MDYFVGLILSIAACGTARLAGFDRERGFYPTILCVIATYYVLFAAMGGGGQAVLLESMIATVFMGIAVAGFKGNLWAVVLALAVHALFDLMHHHILRNDGVPGWWPGSCMAFDIVAAVCLGALLLKRALPPRNSGTGRQRLAP
ncbi:hypothetical protein E4K72_05970 [Oxalobacteraceae bacterium OM1]|nr:hypothetical protein E4K72_05970 [Oxalobacteraceae bacterium OM1]